MMIFQRDPLTVFQSALFQTNSAVVEGQDFVLVVDPTWLPQEVEEIAAFVRAVRAGRPLYLLFTHSDFDHILGYGAFPGATTIASREFTASPNPQRSVDAVLAWDSEYYIQRPYPIVYPEISIAADHDGQTLAFGTSSLTFYKAPGHNPDGLLTVMEPQGVLLAGDYFSDIEFPYIYQSSTAYEATLGKLDHILEQHSVGILVPGHGLPAADHQEMRQRQRLSFDYIHALRRHLAASDQPAIDKMLDDYAFPLGMKSFHDGNQALVRAELAAGGSGVQSQDLPGILVL